MFQRSLQANAKGAQLVVSRFQIRDLRVLFHQLALKPRPSTRRVSLRAPKSRAATSSGECSRGVGGIPGARRARVAGSARRRASPRRDEDVERPLAELETHGQCAHRVPGVFDFGFRFRFRFYSNHERSFSFSNEGQSRQDPNTSFSDVIILQMLVGQPGARAGRESGSRQG